MYNCIIAFALGHNMNRMIVRLSRWGPDSAAQDARAQDTTAQDSRAQDTTAHISI